MPESVAELRRRYVSGCYNSRWREAIIETENSPAKGLYESVNIRNFDLDTQRELNNRWLAGALSEDAYRKYLENTSNNSWKWAQNFGDASRWDL